MFHVVPLMEFIRFSRACSHVEDFNACNKCLTAKLLKQVYRYHKLRKAFSKFYRWHHEFSFKIQCQIKMSFTSRPIGTRILW